MHSDGKGLSALFEVKKLSYRGVLNVINLRRQARALYRSPSLAKAPAAHRGVRCQRSVNINTC